MKPSVMHGNAWKFALPTLVLLAALACAFAFSEPVRAKTLEVIRVIAGYTVEERSESPLKALDPGEAAPTPAALGAAIVPQATLPAPAPAEVTEVPVPAVPAADVIANPPFAFNLPGWVPEGYALSATAGVTASNNWVALAWDHPERGEIELLVERDYTGYSIPVGADSSQEIEINGRPALLVRGFWDGEHQWDPRRGISLNWEQGGHHYTLNYAERGPLHNEIVPIAGDMEAITAELVKMAESVR